MIAIDPGGTGDLRAGRRPRRYTGVLAKIDGVRTGHCGAADWREFARDFLKLPGEEPWPLVNPEITGKARKRL